jgi:hypothetical protein
MQLELKSSREFQLNLSHKLVIFSLGPFTWRKHSNGILSYCFNNYILQLHQLQHHFAPIDKLCHWYADSIQAAVHFQNLGFIHVRCWGCCNMLLYITVNIPNINTSECRSLRGWSMVWVVMCCVFLSNGRSHIVQKNIRRNSSETRVIILGQSSWLQLGGWYLWLLSYAGMFPRTSVHSLWFFIYGHSVEC